MTSTPPPAGTPSPPPAGTSGATRRKAGRRSGPQRILFGYLSVLVAAAVGAIGLPVAAIGANQCTADGFECLGWLFIGAAVGIAVAALALFGMARLTRTGWPFALVVLLLLGVAAAIPGLIWLRYLIALLTPLAAALITAPRPLTDTERRRTVRIGVISLLVLVLLLLGSVVLQTLFTVNSREELYAGEGVHPVGLSEDRGWDYEVVIERGGPDRRGFGYRLVDQSDNEVQVEIDARDLSAYDPPNDCSPDPHGTAPCRELAPGVWADGDLDNRRVIATDEAIVTLLHSVGPMTDDELTTLAGRMEPQSHRWLATRECRLCRLF